NICAGLLWGSVTSPTTSPGVCSSPVASDRFYTLNYDEPDFRTTGRPEPGAHTADSSAFSCGCSTSFPQAICRLWPPSRGSMSNRSMTAFRLASRYTALLLTVLTVASLIGLGPALAAGPPSGLGEVPVLTAPNAYGPGIWHHAKAGKTWYGSYRTFPDTSAYCIDAGKKSPLSKYFRGATSEPATSAQTAWALHEYADSKSKDVQAALSAIARLDKTLPHDHKVPPQKPADLGRKFTGAAKQHSSILTKAKRYAGPYTLHVSLEPVLRMPVLAPHTAPESDTSPDSWASDSNDTDAKELGAKDSEAPDRDTGGDKDEGRILGTPTDEARLTISLTSASAAQVPDVPVTLGVDG